MYIRRIKLEIDYAVYSLSDRFYEKYPNPPYKELLKKCRTMKGELEAEIVAKEEIIDIYKAIM